MVLVLQIPAEGAKKNCSKAKRNSLKSRTTRSFKYSPEPAVYGEGGGGCGQKVMSEETGELV